MDKTRNYAQEIPNHKHLDSFIDITIKKCLLEYDLDSKDTESILDDIEKTWSGGSASTSPDLDKTDHYYSGHQPMNGHVKQDLHLTGLPNYLSNGHNGYSSIPHSSVPQLETRQSPNFVHGHIPLSSRSSHDGKFDRNIQSLALGIPQTMVTMVTNSKVSCPGLPLTSGSPRPAPTSSTYVDQEPLSPAIGSTSSQVVHRNSDVMVTCKMSADSSVTSSSPPLATTHERKSPDTVEKAATKQHTKLKSRLQQRYFKSQNSREEGGSSSDDSVHGCQGNDELIDSSMARRLSTDTLSPSSDVDHKLVDRNNNKTGNDSSTIVKTKDSLILKLMQTDFDNDKTTSQKPAVDDHLHRVNSLPNNNQHYPNNLELLAHVANPLSNSSNHVGLATSLVSSSHNPRYFKDVSKDVTSQIQYLENDTRDNVFRSSSPKKAKVTDSDVYFRNQSVHTDAAFTSQTLQPNNTRLREADPCPPNPCPLQSILGKQLTTPLPRQGFNSLLMNTYYKNPTNQKREFLSKSPVSKNNHSHDKHLERQHGLISSTNHNVQPGQAIVSPATIGNTRIERLGTSPQRFESAHNFQGNGFKTCPRYPSEYKDLRKPDRDEKPEISVFNQFQSRIVDIINEELTRDDNNDVVAKSRDVISPVKSCGRQTTPHSKPNPKPNHKDINVN